MMIVQFILFFVLGAVATAFLLMLLAPVLWNRALLLAYNAVKTEVPLSLTEVEADRDFLRAQHAVNLCRLEEKLKEEQDSHIQRRIELNAAQEQMHYLAPLEPLCSELKSKVNDNERLIHDLQQIISERDEQVKELSNFRPQCAAQQKQLQQQERKIIQLENNNARLKDQLKNTAKIDTRMLRSFRDEIKTIAAQVAAGIAQDEGRSSRILKLIADVADDNGLASAIRHQSEKLDIGPTKRRRSRRKSKQSA